MRRARRQIPSEAQFCPHCGNPRKATEIFKKTDFIMGYSGTRYTDQCRCGTMITPGSGVCESCKL